MTTKGGTVREIRINGVSYDLEADASMSTRYYGQKWKHAELRKSPNKLYFRIGRLIIEAGWYSGEPPCIGVKAFEWFADCGEVVILRVQLVKAILCVSWDYGRR